MQVPAQQSSPRPSLLKEISKIKLLLVRCFDIFTLQAFCSVTTNKL
ncbi:hypothetical protein HMPREF1991_02025 [Hoylesella loescheii DSM 19665 = JCM 12249 = ATCC 15930]|uniref:Uncharacterized protein n=1 Tax=Hoylesella loescheii DSM 19665 = JCM 12249 = ATCC 15930 TaxID=1122985 RepID=A0A069QGR5_HOYLO|nr:hypothetical protein HMPREF1991_02025 [Hoylesella loescheii DSM 19665 = JCM 12249 = ATCC 15930]